MFSKRIANPDSDNGIARLWAERERAGLPLLDLTAQNPTQAGFEYPEEALVRALGRREALRYEPHPLGLPRAREVLVENWSQRGFDVSADDILLTASTSEAYALLFKLLCDPGDEVLIPEPSYPLFEVLARLDGIVTQGYRLGYDGAWSIDLESVHAALTERTRALVVVSPNNPTGSYLKRGELQALAELGVPLIVDEVFWPYAFGPDTRRAASALECGSGLVFVLDGLSKRAALPGLKLCWVTVGGEAPLKREALARLELANDSYLSASTPVMHALGELLQLTEPLKAAIVERTRINKDALVTGLNGSAAHALYVEGGWYACLRLPETETEETWVSRFAEAGVRVHPGWFYDFSSGAHGVVSLLVEPETFRQGLETVRRVVETG